MTVKVIDCHNKELIIFINLMSFDDFEHIDYFNWNVTAMKYSEF